MQNWQKAQNTEYNAGSSSNMIILRVSLSPFPIFASTTTTPCAQSCAAHIFSWLNHPCCRPTILIPELFSISSLSWEISGAGWMVDIYIIAGHMIKFSFIQFDGTVQILFLFIWWSHGHLKTKVCYIFIPDFYWDYSENGLCRKMFQNSVVCPLCA